MRTVNTSVFKRAIINKLLILPFLFLLIQGCMPGYQSEEKEEDKDEMISKPIKIITTSMEFQTVDTIASGWQTFHYENRSYENHFFLLDKYPEGKKIADGEKEVMLAFQKGMDLIIEGKPDEAMAEFGKLPDWYSDVVFMGGSGLISPEKTAITTLKVEPGYYVMECYVKMANGMFHSSMGMVKALIVTDDSVRTPPPVPDVRINVSKTSGIQFKDEINKGEQIFLVNFVEQTVYDNFVGHDVHLVRIEEGAEINELEKWMNWANPKGLMTPAPQEFTFLGGVNDMPAGNTGYFSADLSPGSYAFIAEVPEPSKYGLLKRFEVR